MPRITKPTDKLDSLINAENPLSWRDFVKDIITGKYVLLIGSEVVLQKEFGNGDSNKDILDSIITSLKEAECLGHNFVSDTFTEFERKSQRRDVKQLVVNELLGPNAVYQCSTDVVSLELKQLLRTKFFRIVMTTTFDEYLENVMREIWGNELRVLNIYDDGRAFDFDDKEQSADEFDIRPTLYYICGKVNDRGKKFVVTENDAIETVARWMGTKPPTNFLNNIRHKGLISLGCKFDDWLFRFIWYVLRKDINAIDTSLKDAVAVSFTSESGMKLQDYLKSQHVYTETDARAFMNKILLQKDLCIKDIALSNKQLGGIFISYAREDMPMVSSIVDRLNREGFNVWFDSAKLESGDNYDARIAHAIASCKVFIPILSTQVKIDLDSDHVNRYYMATEWNIAKQKVQNIENGQQGGMHVMPIAINGYDERADYHQKFPFSNNSVVNLMNTPMSRFINELKSKLN